MSTAKKLKNKSIYHKFDKIDGSHPIKNIVPDGFVDYPARVRSGGKINYFNFELAEEMGLIPKDHEAKLNSELESKIIETFSIQIINEYDQMRNRKFPESQMKKGTYMATRYLQLQHEDKKGKTSGDGRSIWNGSITHKAKVWDISSCGTGGTCLSPATSKYNKFFETGDPSISYGCGFAEVDEGLATALMSKIFQYNGMKTEECLCIIEFENNYSINVRAYSNLLRPSHFFLYLKQDRLEDLTNLMDYHIEREIKNNHYEINSASKAKYDFMLRKFNQDFAHLVADFEDQYIFCWLDWDGDNILMDGGIIDYGSIRQFGLFHNEYRYDDIERYSTNLSEQKLKAKLIVQNMCQAIDYIKTGIKKPLNEFTSCIELEEFEHFYNKRKNYNLLYRVGFSDRKIKQFLKREENLVNKFKKTFSYFEKFKSYKGEEKVSDGINTNAIFSMRDLLRELPQVILFSDDLVTVEEMVDMMKTSYARPKDLNFSSYARKQAQLFISQYTNLVDRMATLFQEEKESTLLGMIERSQSINMPDRMTGDAITHIVDLIMKQGKSFKAKDKSRFINEISYLQITTPEKEHTISKKTPSKLVEEALHILQTYREGL